MTIKPEGILINKTSMVRDGIEYELQKVDGEYEYMVDGTTTDLEDLPFFALAVLIHQAKTAGWGEPIEVMINH